MEFLKGIISDELYTKLAEELKDKKDVKLANLATGSYISKEKFDAKETELAGIKSQLEDASKEIQSYKDLDIEGIKTSAKNWEEKYKTDTKKLQDDLAKKDYEYAADKYLSKYKFTSDLARKAVISEFNQKGFKLENGTFLGADDYIKQLQESNPSAFENDDKPPQFADKTSGTGGTSNDNALRAAMGLEPTKKII